jgi:DNA replication protein DnaC
MLNHPVLTQLDNLGLRGMSRAFLQQQHTPQALQLPFEERLGLLLEHEQLDRYNHRLTQRLRLAKLAISASLEDLDLRSNRGLDRPLLTRLTDLSWLDQSMNVLITGPTGVGKSYLACALAYHACRHDHSVRYYRLPRLQEDLVKAGALQKKAEFYKALAKVRLLVLDDFGLTPLTDQFQRDLLEMLDDRYNRQSTLITSQLPVEQWHGYLGDPTLADAILDRLIHNAYRFALKGESMRKMKAKKPVDKTTDADNKSLNNP